MTKYIITRITEIKVDAEDEADAADQAYDIYSNEFDVQDQFIEEIV